MKQKEAIEKALQMLGGRATLQSIYPLAIEIGDFSGSKQPKATIRGCLQSNPKLFRHSPGMPDGWYELVSFQEEIASRDRRIAELEAENVHLKSVKTEDEFVRRLVKETKKLYKHEKDKIEVVRQILYKVGRNDAEEELDAWIEGREFAPSVNVTGDLVMNKYVDKEVTGVASGATGISVIDDKEQTA